MKDRLRLELDRGYRASVEGVAPRPQTSPPVLLVVLVLVWPPVDLMA